ncbi:MAG: WhiB family transcriptional regulator [Ilumatobacteraceae bacterium]
MSDFNVERFQLRAEWTAHAACRDMDTALFFPERGEVTSTAKAVCSGCPVVAECLAYAMNTPERHGVWGGLSERQRRRLRNGDQRRIVPRPITHGTRGGYIAHRRRGEPACDDCRRRCATEKLDARRARALT